MHRKKCLCCSFCLALSFSHFLPHTFLPSWPALQFLFLALSLPKGPGVKSAEDSVFLLGVVVISGLCEHHGEPGKEKNDNPWRKTRHSSTLQLLSYKDLSLQK